MTWDIFKRLLTIATIAGLALLALFIASETDNILATRNKAILLVMPGVPILVAIGLLHVLKWERYFVLSPLWLWLFSAGLLAVAIVETVTLQRFYDILISLNPDFSDGFSGTAGRYGLELRTRSALANLTGAVYAVAWLTGLIFLAYGALKRPAGAAAAAPADPSTRASRRRVSPGTLVLAVVGIVIITFAALWQYTDVPEPPPVMQTAPAAQDG